MTLDFVLKFSGDYPDYEKQLSRFCAKAARRMRDRMREKLREKKSGKRYKKVYKSGAVRYHTASAPGEAPANYFGDFSRSLLIEFGPDHARVWTPLDYPGLLEDGTKNIKPRPLWQPTIDELMPLFEDDLAELMNGA